MEITEINGNWVKGTHRTAGNNFAFSAKVFPEPNTDFGISNPVGEGHISKLHVTDERNEEVVTSYSRGWSKNEVPAVTEGIVEWLERDAVLARVEEEVISTRAAPMLKRK